MIDTKIDQDARYIFVNVRGACCGSCVYLSAFWSNRTKKKGVAAALCTPAQRLAGDRDVHCPVHAVIMLNMRHMHDEAQT